MLTTTLPRRHPGITFLAKNFKGTAMVKTYANMTQANNAAEKAGEGFEVYVTTPWLVGKED